MAPVIPRAEVETLVVDLAARYRLAVVPAVAWVPGSAGVIRRDRETVVLELGEQLLAVPAAARFVAAHELGHVVLGHTSRSSHRRAVALLVIPFLVLLATGAAGAWLWTRDAAAAAGLGAVAAVLAQRWVWRVGYRDELAADGFAASHGAPLTADVAAALDDPGLAGRITGWLFPTHPAWAQRLTVTPQ